MRKEIEDRLVKFSSSTFHLTGKMIKSDYSLVLSNQLLRSSTSSALNYGEAQGAETKKDFIHKIGIVIKELRESHINLQIIKESQICEDVKFLENIIRENNELLSIFFATLKTAKKNL